MRRDLKSEVLVISVYGTKLLLLKKEEPFDDIKEKTRD